MIIQLCKFNLVSFFCAKKKSHLINKFAHNFVFLRKIQDKEEEQADDEKTITIKINIMQ